MGKKLGLFAIALFSAAFMSAPVRGALIDDFNTGGGAVNAPSAGSDTDTSAAASAIGGSRTLDIPGAVAVSGPSSLNMSANFNSNGVLLFELGSGTIGSAFLTWGPTLGGVDLTDAGLSNYVTFDILDIDQGSVDLIVTVTDTGADVATRTLSGAGLGTQQFLFSTFTNFANVDFASVDKITLEIRANETGVDVTIDQFFTSGEISSVPEPATIGMFGIGLVGMALVGRRIAKRR